VDYSRNCVALLLEAGADTLALDTLGGRTPLHLAAWHGRESAVAKLLAAGDSRQVETLDGALGRAPLHLAAWQGHLRVVQLLLQVNERVTRLAVRAEVSWAAGYPTLESTSCREDTCYREYHLPLGLLVSLRAFPVYA
jgi:ankyrin repeat protein